MYSHCVYAAIHTFIYALHYSLHPCVLCYYLTFFYLCLVTSGVDDKELHVERGIQTDCVFIIQDVGLVYVGD